MHVLDSQLRNPLMRESAAHDRARLVAVFPALKACPEPHFLSIRQYLYHRPEKFFDEVAFASFLNWLQRHDETDCDSLKEYFLKCDTEINAALLFLRQINSEQWHDQILRTGDEYDLVRFIDKHIHPTYLRLIEGVLLPLTRLVAHFSRLERGKATDGLDIWSVVQELDKGPMRCFIGSYRNMLRNGIAHGGITFLQDKIRYRDKAGNMETFHSADVVRLLDDLLDTCNGMAAALKVFLLASRGRGYGSPRELLIEELQEETSTPWWTIEGCVESEITGRSQLIVYARPNSRCYAKVLCATVQSGILAESFAPGYDRYFFSLRSRKAWPGWGAFNGKKLRDLREAGIVDLSQYREALENGVIFYVPCPALPSFLGRLDTLAASFRVNLPVEMRRMREESGIPEITCRSAGVHRNSWGAVLRAEVVIEGLDDDAMVGAIREHRRRIVRSAIRHARRENPLKGVAYLPIGYACVGVFGRDYRCRRLSGFGLGSDLVCTVCLQRIRRIKSPDIMGSTVERTGKWRIAWNKAWLEARIEKAY